MEQETPAPSSPFIDHHSLPEELCEMNTEFCEKDVTYSQVKIYDSSNIQETKKNRILKRRDHQSEPLLSPWAGSPWCIAAVIFALLYLIALIIASIMIAKVSCLEGILNTNETSLQRGVSYCEII